MASAQSSSSSKPCLFFLKGYCKRGSQCTFEHIKGVPPPASIAEPCRYYPGNCAEGAKCPFQHGSQDTRRHTKPTAGPTPVLAPPRDFGRPSATAATHPLARSVFPTPPPRRQLPHDPSRQHQWNADDGDDAGGDDVYFYGIGSMESEPTTVVENGPRPVDVRPREPSGPRWVNVAADPKIAQASAAAESSSAARGTTEAAETARPVAPTATTTAAFPSHSVPNSSAAPCHFYFSATGCRSGSSCRFSHDLRPEVHESESSSDTVGVSSDSSMNAAVLPSDAAEREGGRGEGEVWDVSDRECGICFCDVEGSFGLLDSCRHAFCLPCIRGWREKGLEGGAASTVRKCPVCRVACFLVVPSPCLPRSAREKTQMVQAYKKSCADIPCKYFQASSNNTAEEANNKSCPFGSSCLFAHFLADGKTRFVPAAPRLRLNADGATESVGVVQLSHFLDKAGF